MDNHSEFFFVLCLFRKWPIMTFRNILSLIAVSNVCRLTIPPNPCTFIYFHQLLTYVLPSASLAFSMSAECQIFQARFLHYVFRKYHFQILNKSIFLVPIFLFFLLVPPMFSPWFSQCLSVDSHLCCRKTPPHLQRNSSIFTNL